MPPDPTPMAVSRCACGIKYCRICHPDYPVEPVTVDLLVDAWLCRRRAERDYAESSWMNSQGRYYYGGIVAKARRTFDILMHRAAGLPEPVGGSEYVE